VGFVGGLVLGSLSGRGQADLVAEGRKARIALVAQEERIVEKSFDTGIAALPGPIEPLEGPLRIVAQSVDLRDLKGSAVSPLPGKYLKCRIGRAAIRADLPCEGER
jgi:hypothetical protein